MANYFQGISNHFTPLDLSKLNITPPNVPFVSEVPCFSKDYELYELVKGAKKTFSVPGDISPKIFSGMLPAFIKPINAIIKTAIQAGVYPTKLMVEWMVALSKVYPPSGFNKLRLTQTNGNALVTPGR